MIVLYKYGFSTETDPKDADRIENSVDPDRTAQSYAA